MLKSPVLCRYRPSRNCWGKQAVVCQGQGSKGQAAAFELRSRLWFIFFGDGEKSNKKKKKKKPQGNIKYTDKYINHKPKSQAENTLSELRELRELSFLLLLSKASCFPSAPPGREVEMHYKYSCPSSLLLVLTVQLMPPMMLLHLLSLLFLLFLFLPPHTMIPSSSCEILCLSVPFALLRVVPFVTSVPV